MPNDEHRKDEGWPWVSDAERIGYVCDLRSRLHKAQAEIAALKADRGPCSDHKEFDEQCESCYWTHVVSNRFKADIAARDERIKELLTPIPETYACQRCGRKDGLDAVLHDDDWARISEAAGGVNLLCLWCMDVIAEELDIRRIDTHLAFCGKRLVSSDAFAAAVIIQRMDEERSRAEQAEQERDEARAALAASEARVQGLEAALAVTYTPEMVEKILAAATPEPAGDAREAVIAAVIRYVETDMPPHSDADHRTAYGALLHAVNEYRWPAPPSEPRGGEE